MNKNERNMSNTPHLRFPGFTGEWKEKKLGEVTIWDKFFQGVPKQLQSKVIKYPYVLANVFSDIERKEGTVLLLSTGNYVGWTTEELAGSNLCEGEVVAIPWGGTANVKYAKGKFVTADNRIATSSDVSILNNKFLYYFLLSNKDIIDGFYRGAGIKHPSMFDVLNMPIVLPSLPEQQKIASCLSEIDNLIAAQDQKVDALKEKKKGLMQQLFPQLGETTPKLRFAGFDGDWIEKKLGEVADFQNGYSYNSSTFVDEGDYVIRISDIKDGTISLKSAVRSTTKVSDVFKVVKGDILIAMSGATTGKIGEYRNDNVAYINQRVGNIKPFDINKKLLLFLLQSDFFTRYLNGILTVGAQPNISSQQICSFGFMLPSSDSEQKQIAECLSELEDLIFSESDKLDALKDHKKGLMQQLFPQPSK